MSLRTARLALISFAALIVLLGESQKAPIKDCSQAFWKLWLALQASIRLALLLWDGSLFFFLDAIDRLREIPYERLLPARLTSPQSLRANPKFVTYKKCAHRTHALCSGPCVVPVSSLDDEVKMITVSRSQETQILRRVT